MNTELFKQIHDIITVRPEGFSMSTWESPDACGTTRCLSGWAIHLTTGQPLFTRYGTHHPSVKGLAERLGVQEDFEFLGAKILGLDGGVAAELFYAAEPYVLRFVELAAEGRDQEAYDYFALTDVDWCDE